MWLGTLTSDSLWTVLQALETVNKTTLMVSNYV